MNYRAHTNTIFRPAAQAQGYPAIFYSSTYRQIRFFVRKLQPRHLSLFLGYTKEVLV